MKRIAVLISKAGLGTNLQAIIDGVKSGKINGFVVVVISDIENAYGLTRAQKNNIPTEISPDKEDLFNLLKEYNVDFVVLAGWKQFLTKDVMNAYQNKIINLHPSLIP